MFFGRFLLSSTKINYVYYFWYQCIAIINISHTGYFFRGKYLFKLEKCTNTNITESEKTPRPPVSNFKVKYLHQNVEILARNLTSMRYLNM